MLDRDTLLELNAGFSRAHDVSGLTILPIRLLAVIGCADPRVDPQQVLGLELGDAVIVRNIGGRVVGPTLDILAGLRALSLAVLRAAGAPSGVVLPGLDVVVLHHTDCGILRLVDDAAALAGYLGVDPEDIAEMHVTDPWAAAQHDARVLIDSRVMPGMRVWPVVYDVATGLIDVLPLVDEPSS